MAQYIPSSSVMVTAVNGIVVDIVGPEGVKLEIETVNA